MPTTTYTPLANITLGSSASSVTFSSISQSYRDLILVVQGKTTGSNTAYMSIRLNSDTAANYHYIFIRGNGSVAATSTGPSQTYGILTSVAPNTGENANGIAQFMDYSATDKQKAVLARGDKADSGTSLAVNRWANTSAITSIQVAPGGFNAAQWAIGTTMSLFGIVA